MTARDAGDLLALDPSIHSAGLALFRRGRLVAARTLKREREAAGIGERAAAMSLDIIAWLRHVHADPRTFVYEWPQIYTYDKSVGDPNDLIALAAIGNGVATVLQAAAAARNICVEFVSPKPAEWIGQLPKSRTGSAWASPRGARIKSRLSLDESRHAPDQHDVVDAIGLGLWALGRLDRVRVFPGAT